MLDLKEIKEEIKKLEHTDRTTYDVCEKLAMLYTVRDHYAGGATPAQDMQSPATPSVPSAPALR